VAGGLASYGASNRDAFRLVGGYAGRILSGKTPADLPVQQVMAGRGARAAAGDAGDRLFQQRDLRHAWHNVSAWLGSRLAGRAIRNPHGRYGTRIAGVMFNSDTYPFYDRYLQMLQAEPRRPVEVVRVTVRSPAEIDAAILALTARPSCGLVVLPDGGFTVANRAAIQAAVDRHRLPSIAPWRQFVSDGALMSYGPDTVDIFRRSADYVDRILKGAKPGELPVQRPVKFELVSIVRPQPPSTLTFRQRFSRLPTR
jgi:hypothetical protein